MRTNNFDGDAEKAPTVQFSFELGLGCGVKPISSQYEYRPTTILVESYNVAPTAYAIPRRITGYFDDSDVV